MWIFRFLTVDFCGGLIGVSPASPDADEQLRRMSEGESSSSAGLLCGEDDNVCLDSSSSSSEPEMHSDLKEGYDDNGAPTTAFANAQNLLPMAAVICILLILAWILYRHLKQQSEWQRREACCWFWCIDEEKYIKEKEIKIKVEHIGRDTCR